MELSIYLALLSSLLERVSVIPSQVVVVAVVVVDARVLYIVRLLLLLMLWYSSY